jgi:hypothetical protein
VPLPFCNQFYVNLRLPQTADEISSNATLCEWRILEALAGVAQRFARVTDAEDQRVA